MSLKAYVIHLPNGVTQRVEGSSSVVNQAGALIIMSDHGYEDLETMVRAYAPTGWVRVEVQATC